MSQRQRDDMVMPAHIREQRRLSLQSYGRPRMTEKLQDLGVCVGPPEAPEWYRDHQNPEIPADDGQQSQVQHCAKPTGDGLLSRSRDPGLGHGSGIATTAERLQSSYGLWVAILFKRVPKAPEQAQLQGLDEWQRQLLRL